MPVYDEEKLEKKPAASDGEHDNMGIQPELREAESSEWQNRYDSPSYNNAPISSENLKTAESTPNDTETDKDPLSNNLDDQVGKGYKPTKTPKRKSRFSRRQKIIGGSTAGILTAAILSVSSILQAPFQFIHFAQILQRHASQIDNIMDDQQLARVRYRRRLGLAGNKAADIVEKKLNAAGYTSKYDASGYFKGFSIDPTKVDTTALQGLGAEVNIDTSTGEIILTENGANFKRRRLVNNILDSADMRSIPSRISSRLLKKRGGVSFKLLGNIDRKSYTTTQSYWDAVLQKFKDYYKNGGAFRLHTTSDDKNDDGSEPTEEQKNNRKRDNADFQEDADKIASNPSDENIENLGNEVDAGKFSGKSADALGFFCAARAVGRSYQLLQHSRIILPLIRIGSGYMSIGNQVMSNKGVTFDELGAYSTQLYDKKEGSSWTSARSIQYELGQELTGPDMPASAKPGRIGNKPAFFSTVESVPMGSQACKVNDSTVGGIGISILTGGFASNLFFEGLSRAGIDPIGKLIQGAISWAVGKPLKDSPKGALLGNYANYGNRLAVNDRFISVGGRELSDEEAVALKQETLREERDNFANLPIKDRLFGLNHRSLLSQVSIHANDTDIKNIGSFAASIIKSPGSLLSRLFNKKAVAANEYDYGFPLFGFSSDEKNNDTFANPYVIDEKVEPRLLELNEKYGKCFATTIDPTTKAIITGETVNYYNDDYVNGCRVKPGHPEYTDFTMYRFYILGKVNERSVECYGGIEDSCRQLGYGETASNSQPNQTNPSNGKIVGDPYTDSTSVPCAEGTKDIGIQDGYREGVKFAVRLCSVSNLPSKGQADNPGGAFTTPGADGHAIVNSRVSGAWYTLAKDASTAGHNLTVFSSFRSMKHQEYVWEENGRDTSRVARPGFSGHQAGVAIDFNNMSGSNKNNSCSSRARAPSNPAWIWLRDNAERYGFKQFSNEAWHWDALPIANRCGTAQP